MMLWRVSLHTINIFVIEREMFYVCSYLIALKRADWQFALRRAICFECLYQGGGDWSDPSATGRPRLPEWRRRRRFRRLSAARYLRLPGGCRRLCYLRLGTLVPDLVDDLSAGVPRGRPEVSMCRRYSGR